MPKEETLENSVRSLSRIFPENHLIMEIPDNQTMKMHKIQVPFIDSIVKAFEDGKQIKFKGKYSSSSNQALAYISLPLSVIDYIISTVFDILLRRKIENPWNHIKNKIDELETTRYWGNLIINDEIYNLRGSYHKYGPVSPQTIAISKNY